MREDENCNRDPEVVGDLDHILLACPSTEREEFEEWLKEKKYPLPLNLSFLLNNSHCIMIKKSLKGIPESEIEEKLSKSIRIFDYIEDKDMFITFYAKKLSKRLIYQQTNSLDEEEAMIITRLKVACGYSFTNKLTQMFTDIK